MKAIGENCLNGFVTYYTDECFSFLYKHFAMYTVTVHVISHVVPYPFIFAKAEGPKTLTVIKYQMKYWTDFCTYIFFSFCVAILFKVLWSLSGIRSLADDST